MIDWEKTSDNKKVYYQIFCKSLTNEFLIEILSDLLLKVDQFQSEALEILTCEIWSEIGAIYFYKSDIRERSERVLFRVIVEDFQNKYLLIESIEDEDIYESELESHLSEVGEKVNKCFKKINSAISLEVYDEDQIRLN